jgi:hypothetical protein
MIMAQIFRRSRISANSPSKAQPQPAAKRQTSQDGASRTFNKVAYRYLPVYFMWHNDPHRAPRINAIASVDPMAK